MTEEQLLAIAEVAFDRSLFDGRTLSALDYADAMSTGAFSPSFVSDEAFARVAAHFSTEEIVVLTGLIAWENASARFNRALGVESQGLWKR